jgi:hypothetical protein
MADAGFYILLDCCYAHTEAAVGFFKGTSADQDRRFSDKELKLLKSLKFPPEFDKKVCNGFVDAIVN